MVCLTAALLRFIGSYCAHPIMDRPIMQSDRFGTRIDQGERIFDIWINAGTVMERTDKINAETLYHNEKPYTLSFFPSGMGKTLEPLILVSDEAVQMTAFKKSENTDDHIVRLFEATGKARTATIEIPFLNIKKEIHMKSFEIKTFKVGQDLFTEVDLMENV